MTKKLTSELIERASKSKLVSETKTEDGFEFWFGTGGMNCGWVAINDITGWEKSCRSKADAVKAIKTERKRLIKLLTAATDEAMEYDLCVTNREMTKHFRSVAKKHGVKFRWLSRSPYEIGYEFFA